MESARYDLSKVIESTGVIQSCQPFDSSKLEDPVEEYDKASLWSELELIATGEDTSGWRVVERGKVGYLFGYNILWSNREVFRIAMAMFNGMVGQPGANHQAPWLTPYSLPTGIFVKINTDQNAKPLLTAQDVRNQIVAAKGVFPKSIKVCQKCKPNALAYDEHFGALSNEYHAWEWRVFEDCNDCPFYLEHTAAKVTE